MNTQHHGKSLWHNVKGKKFTLLNCIFTPITTVSKSAMHTVKDCERYNTVRELLLLHELPVSPSPRRPDELSCDSPWSMLSPCKLAFSSHRPGPKAPKSPPLSPSAKALFFLILHVFTAHTFFTSNFLSQITYEHVSWMDNASYTSSSPVTQGTACALCSAPWQLNLFQLPQYFPHAESPQT